MHATLNRHTLVFGIIKLQCSTIYHLSFSRFFAWIWIALYFFLRIIFTRQVICQKGFVHAFKWARPGFPYLEKVYSGSLLISVAFWAELNVVKKMLDLDFSRLIGMEKNLLIILCLLLTGVGLGLCVPSTLKIKKNILDTRHCL